MKKTRNFILLAVMSIIFTNCKDDDEDVYLITQGELDNVIQKIDEVTGPAAGVLSVPHDGTANSSDSTYRLIYSSKNDLSGTLEKGTIITKRVYNATPDGMPGSTLKVTFAMVKRESGYNSSAGDWEFIMMPFDQSNNYTSHPNGILPASEGATRGKLASCIACHAGAGGGDYLFVNDQ